jgi:hypothetical protein
VVNVRNCTLREAVVSWSVRKERGRHNHVVLLQNAGEQAGGKTTTTHQELTQGGMPRRVVDPTIVKVQADNWESAHWEQAEQIVKPLTKQLDRFFP